MASSKFPTVSVALFVAAALSLCLAPLFAQDPAFVAAAGSPVEVGAASGQLALVDLDRDGRLDLIAQRPLHGVLAIRRGDGKGGLESADGGSLELGYLPRAMAVGDIDGDGFVDLAIADQKDEDKEYVRIHLGDADLRFVEAEGSPIAIRETQKGYKPRLALVDLDEDGHLDLVASNGRRNVLDILLGNGLGQFAPKGALDLPGPHQFTFATGDVDGDGHLDFVIAATGEVDAGKGLVAVKRGDGTGAFVDASSSSADRGVRIAALADVNGDGRPDAILHDYDRSRVTVRFNDGRGGFGPNDESALDVGLPAFAVVVADVNGDQKPDLSIATVDSRNQPFRSKVVVLLGDGVGKFAPAAGSPYEAGLGAYNLAVGDLNADGREDIVASSFESEAVTLLLGRR